MFQTALGNIIPSKEKLVEGYQIFTEQDALRVIISFEKLESLIIEFIRGLKEPMGMYLHIPLNKKQEEAFNDSNGVCHDAIMRLGPMNKDEMLTIFLKYKEILLNDGMSQFSIGSKNNGEELFVKKYKVIELFKNHDLHIKLLKKLGLEHSEELILPYDLFTMKAPGECNLYKNKDMTIYDVVEELKEKGLVLYKIIEAD